MHPVDSPQKRGFARAGAADDGNELPVLNGQGHIVQTDGAVGVYFGYVVKFDHIDSSLEKPGAERARTADGILPCKASPRRESFVFDQFADSSRISFWAARSLS